jgi:SAM-dependent methyltransferase
VDTLELYRWAVQDPETHAEVLRIMYQCLHPSRRPSVLREDFAGTAAESVAWVALQKGRSAVAVDLDGPTIAWARQRADRILGSRVQSIEFVAGDVMEVRPPRVPAADIISVLNCSILYFRERESLGAYLANAGRCLAQGGLLVLNTFGGTEAMRARTDRHRVAPTPRLPTEVAVPPFEYIWEQRSYDVDSASLDCRIHFNIPDPDSPGGVREIRDAFRYDWRLWPLQELIRELHAAGFDNVQVWRHTYDPAKGRAGLFLGPLPVSEVEALDHWTAYIVARRTATDPGRPTADPF